MDNNIVQMKKSIQDMLDQIENPEEIRHLYDFTYRIFLKSTKKKLACVGAQTSSE